MTLLAAQIHLLAETLAALARPVPLHLMAQDTDQFAAAPELLALIRMGQIEEEGARHDHH